MVPDLFSDLIPPDIGAYRKTLRKTLDSDPGKIQNQIDQLLENREIILIRTGGGMRDSYNLGRYGFEKLSQDWSRILASDYTIVAEGHPTIIGYQGTLHSRVENLKMFSADLKDPKYVEAVAKARKTSIAKVMEKSKDYIAHELAGINMALA